MHRRHFLTTLGTGAAVWPTLLSTTASASDEKPAAPPDEALTEKLERIRQEHKVPALAAARFNLDGITRQAATGVRKAGGTKPVTTTDLWHLGSMTKAMTATLLATYVQDGRLKWDDTLGKLIPDSCKRAHPLARDITVSQLLHHQSGLPANLSSWWLLPKASQRDEILRLAAPPDSTLTVPSPYLYSNVGYAIAGHIAEKLDRSLWEEIMEKKLFKPLGITAGQGPVGTEGKDDQPWPHDTNGKPLPENGLKSDNAPSLGPAGRVHSSIENYVRFAADQLRGANGGRALLKTPLYEFLQTAPEGSTYAGGWNVTHRPWAGGKTLTHTGSNTANFFVAWLAPGKSFGVLAACNQGGPTAAAACDAACSVLINET